MDRITPDLEKELVKKLKKYEDLRWYSKIHLIDEWNEERIKRLQFIVKNYIQDTIDLREDFEFVQGLHCGYIAMIRYILSYVDFDKETAEEEFPNLDS